MALAIDGSSPAIATAGVSIVTTAGFNPPDSSLIMACCMANAGSTQNIVATVTNNGDALTWTKRVERTYSEGTTAGYAGIFTAPLATARTGLTVTFDHDGTSPECAIKVFVVTGHDTTTPIGATGEGSSATNDISPTVLTTTANNSRVFGCANDWNDNGLPTSTDTGYGANMSGDDCIAVHKAADTASSGTGVTLNFDAGGAGGAAWNWVAVEVLVAGGASVAPRKQMLTGVGS